MFVVRKATSALTTALTNLDDKSKDLNELGQGNNIYSALEDLEPAYAVSPQPVNLSFYR